MEWAFPFTGGTLTQVLQPLLGPLATTMVRLRSEYGRASADDVLAATDLENLSERLDALGGDQEFWDSELSRTQRPNRETALMGCSVRRAVGLFLRTMAAAAVIARAEERGQRLEPWLALGLADAWALGPERLAAALTDPEAVLPWIATLIAHDETELRARAFLEQWKRAAISSGEGIHLPFAQPEARVDKGSEGRRRHHD